MVSVVKRKSWTGFMLAPVIMFLVILAPVTALAIEQTNFNELLNAAFDKNIDLEMARVQLESTRVDYQKNELYNLMENSRLLKLQGELQLAEAEQNFKDTKAGITIELVGKYLEIIQINQEIKTLEKELQLEKNKLEAIEAQVEIGYKGNLELFEQQNTYQTVRDDLELKRDELEQKISFLEGQIGAPLGEEMIEIKLAYPELWEIEEEAALEKGLSNNIELDFKAREVELAKADLEKARISGVPALDLNKMELNLELAQLALTKTQEELKNKIQQQYFLYQQAVKGLEMASRNMLQARENTAIMEEQHKAGLVSKNDLLTAEVSLMKARNSYITAIINYHTNKLRLQQTLGLELEVEINEE